MCAAVQDGGAPPWRREAGPRDRKRPKMRLSSVNWSSCQCTQAMRTLSDASGPGGLTSSAWARPVVKVDWADTDVVLRMVSGRHSRGSSAPAVATSRDRNAADEKGDFPRPGDGGRRGRSISYTSRGGCARFCSAHAWGACMGGLAHLGALAGGDRVEVAVPAPAVLAAQEEHDGTDGQQCHYPRSRDACYGACRQRLVAIARGCRLGAEILL